MVFREGGGVGEVDWRVGFGFGDGFFRFAVALTCGGDVDDGLGGGYFAESGFDIGLFALDDESVLD